MATLSSIFDFNPGDYAQIDFPENFLLEYRYSKEQPIQSFVCTRMSVYRYDEEDRDDINFYFYCATKTQWVAKSYYLTEQSYDKVCAYIIDKFAKEGKIIVDENGIIIKPYR